MVSIPDTGLPPADLEALLVQKEVQIREMENERLRLLAENVTLKAHHCEGPNCNKPAEGVASKAQLSGAEADRAEEHARCCVAALVTDPAGRLLLIRSRKPGRGWELPGGKVRSAETWREALVREVREEAGLTITITGEPRVLDGRPVEGAAFTSIILVATATAAGEPVAGDDAAEARWFAATDIPWMELSKFASTEEVKRWAGKKEHAMIVFGERGNLQHVIIHEERRQSERRAILAMYPDAFEVLGNYEAKSAAKDARDIMFRGSDGDGRGDRLQAYARVVPGEARVAGDKEDCVYVTAGSAEVHSALFRLKAKHPDAYQKLIEVLLEDDLDVPF